MRILCTNDDGVHARGLDSLVRIARELSDDVWIVAPHEEQSGAARALTLANPIRIRQYDERRFSVSGTPSDAVMMATQKLLGDKAPDLVLSGVNNGQNLAEDVTVSGTIAGASSEKSLSSSRPPSSDTGGFSVLTLRGSRLVPGLGDSLGRSSPSAGSWTTRVSGVTPEEPWVRVAGTEDVGLSWGAFIVSRIPLEPASRPRFAGSAEVYASRAPSSETKPTGSAGPRGRPPRHLEKCLGHKRLRHTPCGAARRTGTLRTRTRGDGEFAVS